MKARKITFLIQNVANQALPCPPAIIPAKRCPCYQIQKRADDLNELLRPEKKTCPPYKAISSFTNPSTREKLLFCQRVVVDEITTILLHILAKLEIFKSFTVQRFLSTHSCEEEEDGVNRRFQRLWTFGWSDRSRHIEQSLFGQFTQRFRYWSMVLQAALMPTKQSIRFFHQRCLYICSATRSCQHLRREGGVIDLIVFGTSELKRSESSEQFHLLDNSENIGHRMLQSGSQRETVVIMSLNLHRARVTKVNRKTSTKGLTVKKKCNMGCFDEKISFTMRVSIQKIFPENAEGLYLFFGRGQRGQIHILPVESPREKEDILL